VVAAGRNVSVNVQQRLRWMVAARVETNANGRTQKHAVVSSATELRIDGEIELRARSDPGVVLARMSQ
jgi:hypothetical protein